MSPTKKHPLLRWAAGPVITVALAACGTSPGTQPTPSASTTVKAQTRIPTATPAATSTVRPEVSPEEECEGSQFQIEQFIGAWQEVDTSSVTTLSQHGSLSSDADGQKQFGTWQFTQAGQTPAADTVPVASACVLWLHWISPTAMDLFYVPLTVTDNRIALSYVGRGNTIEWERAAAQ